MECADICVVQGDFSVSVSVNRRNECSEGYCTDWCSGTGLLRDGYLQTQSRNEWMNQSIFHSLTQSVDQKSVRIHQSENISCTKLHHRTVNEVMSVAVCYRKGACWEVGGWGYECGRVLQEGCVLGGWRVRLWVWLCAKMQLLLILLLSSSSSLSLLLPLCRAFTITFLRQTMFLGI
jgi:hypothetical protein